MAGTFRLDPSAVKRIEGSDLVREGLEAAARKGADAARRAAPVESGRLRDSIQVVSDGDGVRYEATVDYAAAVEFGTVHQEAQPFMRSSIDDAKR